MRASLVFGEALALGLASGPACIAACGPVLVPPLLAQPAGLRPHARYLSVFLSARLLGYMLFAVAAWELGALVSLAPSPRALLTGAVNLLLAAVLVWYAWSAKSLCGPACAGSKLVQIGEKKKRGLGWPGGPGIPNRPESLPSVCCCRREGGPVRQHGRGPALLFLLFLGTSIWFMPFISFGCIARNQAVVTVARMAMALIALYYLAMGIAMLVGRKTYGY